MSAIGGLGQKYATPFEITKNKVMDRGKEVSQFETKVDTALGKSSLSKADYKALKDSMTNGRQTLDAMLEKVGVPKNDIAVAFAKGKSGDIQLNDNQKAELRHLLSGATTDVKGAQASINQKMTDDANKVDIDTNYNGFKEPTDVKKFVEDRKKIDPHFNYSQVAKFVPFATQRKMETDMMVNTLTNAGSPDKTATMQKLFFAMKSGGIQMRQQDGTVKPFPYELATAMSHGNRVCFMLPPGQEKAFNAWLKGNLSNERSALVGGVATPIRGSSHGIQPDKGDQFGFKETKGMGLNVLGRDKNQDFGVNIAVGGKGQKSINDADIQDDGHFGQLLMVTNDGQDPSVTMVGLENSRPGTSDQWGGSHDISCNPNAVSAVGSQKWSDVDAPEGKPKTYGGLIVDLRDFDISTLMGSFNDMPKDQGTMRALCTSGSVITPTNQKPILVVPELDK